MKRSKAKRSLPPGFPPPPYGQAGLLSYSLQEHDSSDWYGGPPPDSSRQHPSSLESDSLQRSAFSHFKGLMLPPLLPLSSKQHVFSQQPVSAQGHAPLQ